MIDHLDHLVLTTANESECIDFYTRVLGMHLESFLAGEPAVERKAFKFGNQKINLHIKDKEFEPKANLPTPGSLDLCFIADRQRGLLSPSLRWLNPENMNSGNVFDPFASPAIALALLKMISGLPSS